MQMLRSSYGLMGIIYEATFRVRPVQPMSVHHVGYSLKEFQDLLEVTKAPDDSMMLYLFPFLDKITVEYRRYGLAGGKPNRLLWKFRNWVWKSAGPGFGYLITKLVPFRRLRYALVDRFNQVLQSIVNRLLQDRFTLAADQIIRYPDKSNWTRYTFSIWAFPEGEYPRILGEYFEFCRDHYQEHGYRCNLLNVAYRIAKDQSSLFSYSYESNVLTLDPVSTGDAGWEFFVSAFNEFCSSRGGTPLFNQTRGITAQQAEKAFGGPVTEFPDGRLVAFRDIRAKFDPEARFLSEYFRELLGKAAVSETTEEVEHEHPE
jgi:FAD/FMN-containing dehydrogenase